MNDDDLRARFDALRSEDARGAPRFEVVVARRRARALAWLVPVGALLVSAAVVLLILFPRSAPPGDREVIHVGLRKPEPLAFLLAPVRVPEDSRP